MILKLIKKTTPFLDSIISYENQQEETTSQCAFHNIYIYIYICICICTYIYIYMYMYVHICIYIYTFMIQELPTNAVAQWAEHRRVMPWAWVRVLTSVIFFYLRRCLLSFSVTLTKRWKVRFLLGLYMYIYIYNFTKYRVLDCKK